MHAGGVIRGYCRTSRRDRVEDPLHRQREELGDVAMVRVKGGVKQLAVSQSTKVTEKS